MTDNSSDSVENIEQDQDLTQPIVESAAEAEDASENSAPAKNPNLHWYVVHVYAGFEFKAKQALEERVRMYHLENCFGEVKVPEETVVELVRGQKKTSSRKFFPNYILVQMVLNQDSWHLVKETPKIVGFLGDASEPSPLSEEEVEQILAQSAEGATAPRAKMNFDQGEVVKVVDGPFAEFSGTIEEVKPDKGKVRVLISIFGRATPVELDFVQIEKV
jgi:transcriptional antiterminator NusG